MMNSSLKQLHPYPFEKLRALFKDVIPADTRQSKISFSIGEPQHEPMKMALQQLVEHQLLFSKYTATKGLLELRQAIASWCQQRHALQHCALDPEQHILPVSGTREGLFSFTQAAIDSSSHSTPVVVMPNPCYQIYEGAALLAGAEPYYLACREDRGFIPDPDDIPESILKRCQLFFVCTPGNPTGAVYSLSDFKRLFELADQYGFIIVSDECYSELYYDESQPPLGLLAACEQLNRSDLKQCVIFNSLSKRSNLPGLRSGFVAGDSEAIKHYLLYRTYHGCTMPVPHQYASIAAWNDEQHVLDNRALYRQKYDQFTLSLSKTWAFDIPPASFYLWPTTPIDDVTFAKSLYEELNIVVLPGQFLSRSQAGVNPGKNRVRIALVPSLSDCIEAANRIQSSRLFSA